MLPFTVAYGVLCIQQKSANLISGKFMWQQTYPYRPPSTMTFHKTQHSTWQAICIELQVAQTCFNFQVLQHLILMQFISLLQSLLFFILVTMPCHFSLKKERKKYLFLKYLTDLDSTHCHLMWSLPTIFLPFTLNTHSSPLAIVAWKQTMVLDVAHVTKSM